MNQAKLNNEHIIVPTPTPTSTPIPSPTPVPSPTPIPTVSPELPPALYRATTFTGGNADWELFLYEWDGIKFVLVPAGCFEMGSTEEELEAAFQLCETSFGAGNCDRNRFDDEKPAHQVCFDDPFWLSRTEVTNEQFAAFLNVQNNQTEGGATWLNDNEDARIHQENGLWTAEVGYEDHPATNMTWYGAQAFCKWIGARLPTEAEWEYAAVGPDGWGYPWGNQFDCTKGNFFDGKGPLRLNTEFLGCDGFDQTAPVGSFPTGKSWVGALDISGNTLEWTSTIYAPYPYQAGDGRENSSDPKGERVLRGSSWAFPVPNWDWARAAIRKKWDPTAFSPAIGLRCALPGSD
jgi:formylglycine-generating enzyme required for sulfatase activity